MKDNARQWARDLLTAIVVAAILGAALMVPGEALDAAWKGAGW